MKRPELIKLKTGKREYGSLVHINGYLSEYDTMNSDEWAESYTRAGWQGDIYLLWWDASNIYSFITRIAPSVFDNIMANRLEEIPFFTYASALAHWLKVKSRAKEVGQDHANYLLSQIKEPYIDISGFSLGTLIAYYLLASDFASSLNIRNCYLIGGIINKNRVIFKENLHGKIINLYNENDMILKSLLIAAEFFKILRKGPPCGITAIPDAVNIDATHLIHPHDIKNHWFYMKILKETLGQYF